MYRFLFSLSVLMPVAVSAAPDNGTTADLPVPLTVTQPISEGGTLEVKATGELIKMRSPNPHVIFDNDPGEPNLPSITVTLALPANADLESLVPRLSQVETDGALQPGVMASVPLQVNSALVEFDGGTVVSENVQIPEGVDPDTGLNTAIYGADQVWPETWIEAATPVVDGNYKAVQVVINLARVNPNPSSQAIPPQSFVEKLQFAQLHVDFEVFPDEPSEPDEAPSDWLSYTVANGGDLDPPNTDGFEGYLIATTGAVMAQTGAAEALEAFRAHKADRGYNAMIFTEESWTSQTGDAAADDFRLWLQANHVMYNWKYVLIVAPPTGASVLPMKTVYPNRNAYQSWATPGPRFTDAYFSDLTGNWDLDGDGFPGEFGHYETPVAPYTDTGDFGVTPDNEEGVNRNAELMVGRIPVYGNGSDGYEELIGILNKIQAYQNAGEDEIDWRRNMLLIGKDPNRYFFGETIREGIVKQVPAEEGVFESYRIIDAPECYDTDDCNPTINDPGINLDDTCSLDGVVERWAEQTPGITTWLTHGSTSYASGVLSSYRLDDLDAADLDGTVYDINDTPAFTFQASCYNSFPNSNNNLAYALLRKGAIATVGATHVSYGPGSPAPLNNIGSNAGLAYGYIKRLVLEKMNAGQALFEAKRVHSANNWWYWTNMVLFNLYGDPEVGLYDHDTTYDYIVGFIPNQQVAASNPISIYVDVTTLDPSYELTIIQKPDFLSFDVNTMTLSGTPTEPGDVGTHDVTLRIGDGAAAQVMEFSITVLAANQPPVYLGETRLTIAAYAEVQFPLMFSDPNGDRLSVRFNHNSQGDWIDVFEPIPPAAEHPFILYLMPRPENVGEHEISVRVSDGQASAEAILQVQVCAAFDEEGRCLDTVNPCANAPCMNGGTCVIQIAGGFKCQCHDGFSGELCETEDVVQAVPDAGEPVDEEAVDSGTMNPEETNDAGPTETAPEDAGDANAAPLDAGSQADPETDAGNSPTPISDAGMTFGVEDAGVTADATDAGSTPQNLPVDSGVAASSDETNVDAGATETVPPTDDDEQDENETDDAEDDSAAGCSCHSMSNSKGSHTMRWLGFFLVLAFGRTCARRRNSVQG